MTSISWIDAFNPFFSTKKLLRKMIDMDDSDKLKSIWRFVEATAWFWLVTGILIGHIIR